MPSHMLIPASLGLLIAHLEEETCTESSEMTLSPRFEGMHEDTAF